MNDWLLEGYDLVFLDYDDGRVLIENNAQVMKEVILHINNIKQGNIQTIVIGASMSGLVARYAIRKMEQDGITHKDDGHNRLQALGFRNISTKKSVIPPMASLGL